MSLPELLEHAAWFGALSAPARAQVRRDLLQRVLAAGESLGRGGDVQHHWFGVSEGLLKWSVHAADGRTVTLGGQSVGSWFGEGTLLRARPRRSDVVALRASCVAMLPFETFDWLRRTEPAFGEFLLHQVNERLHWFMDSYAAHQLLDAQQLVMRALLGLVHPLLNPLGQQRLQLSQEELANLATVSRQRCNQTLARLKEEQVVELEYGAIRILDAARLEALAG
jgi:CRP-like cAMP-binding protein